MKSGRIFWGALFIIVGLLLLLEKFNVVSLEWHYAWRLWPLLLIFWGAALLVRDPKWKWIVALMGAVIVGVILLNVSEFPWSFGGNTAGGPNPQKLTEPYDSTIHTASLRVHTTAGSIVIQDTTGALIDASTHTNVGQYSLTRETVGNEATVRLAFSGRRTRWFSRKSSNQAEVRLNPGPTWDMDFDVAASRLDLDLEPYVVESLSIDAKAASVRVRIGARATETHLRIDGGASSIRLSVPLASSCQATVHGGLSSKRLPEFKRIDSNTYRTDNFDTAEHKVFVEVDAGVSSIKVFRY